LTVQHNAGQFFNAFFQVKSAFIGWLKHDTGTAIGQGIERFLCIGVIFIFQYPEVPDEGFQIFWWKNNAIVHLQVRFKNGTHWAAAIY